jgi:hypothetical protein
MLSIYKLPNQIPSETVIKVIRKDMYILFKIITLSIFLMIIPLIVFVVLFYGKEDLLNNELIKSLVVTGVSAYYLFVWLFSFFNFIDYYLDVWIITSERIIDIEQKGFFSRTISEQKIYNVQDITSETKGMLRTFLKFGYLYIQTAGAKERFVFEDVPDPDGLRDLIIKLVDDHKKSEKQTVQSFE